MKRARFVVLLVLYAVLPVSPPAVEAHHDAADVLKQDMRKLWTDHVVWTRDYIVAALADQPDAQVAANRLMKNQEDIGNAVGTFYGTAAGQQLTTLLKEHISIAVDFIKAAKAGDKPVSRLLTRSGNRTAWPSRTSSTRRTRIGRAPRLST